MKRRGFLQSLLAGGAVLTTVQRYKIEEQIEAEPAPAGPPSVDGVALKQDDLLLSEGGMLRWREPVSTHADLYVQAEDGDATWCESDDTIWLYVGNVGWIQLGAATLA